MPILGAFLWGLVAAIGRMLTWVALRWGGTIIANVLLALGISFVAVKYGAPALQSLMDRGLNQLPADLANLMRYVGFYEACSIVVSAVLWKEGKGIVKGLALKGAST